ncbi:MAG TPA: STAS domain-containing protein [Planctomycetaceae bacterium]|nr:STAS domain-containing protein [Planctomycetaceae bacterium]
MIQDGPKYFATEVADHVLFVAPSPKVVSLTGADLAKDRAEFLQKLRNSDVRGVVFDLAALEAFGSLMLGTLCLTWKQAHDQGARMVLCNVSAIGRQILERSKLASLWPIYQSRDLAVAALRTAEPAKSPLPNSDTEQLGGFETTPRARLQIIELGPRTVIGFGGSDLPPEHVLGQYLSEIIELIETSQCAELCFDLAGVTAIPSGFLGVLASVLKKGVAISVQNPSQEVREVLALTNFDRLIKVL